MMGTQFRSRSLRRNRKVTAGRVATGAAVSAVALALAACSGGSDPAPTVTQTVQAGQGESTATPASGGESGSAQPSPSASATPDAEPSAKPSPSSTPAKPISIQSVQVKRDHEPGHLESERLSVPTLTGAPKKTQDAFDAQVSRRIGEMRDDLLTRENDGEGRFGQSFLKTKSGGSAMYKDRYASALIEVSGAAVTEVHRADVAVSITMDTKTGNVVPLTNFVKLSNSELNALLSDQLKAALKKDGLAEDPFGVLDNVGEYEWMVSDKGVTFRYLAMYEGGWDFAFTVPWDRLGG